MHHKKLSIQLRLHTEGEAKSGVSPIETASPVRIEGAKLCLQVEITTMCKASVYEDH